MKVLYIVGGNKLSMGKLEYIFQERVVNLGGGFVQTAYAIFEADAIEAPKALDGEDPYMKEI